MQVLVQNRANRGDTRTRNLHRTELHSDRCKVLVLVQVSRAYVNSQPYCTKKNMCKEARHSQEACTSSGTRFLGVCVSPEDEIKRTGDEGG